MKFGELEFVELGTAGSDLLSKPTQQSIEKNKLGSVLVSEIDPNLSDTAAFCEKYQVEPSVCANCVIVAASRGERTWFAAVMIGGDKRADINGVVRRHLDAKKISFAPMAQAIELTGMEFGAINPIGLPDDWPILVDSSVARLPHAIIGSGIRQSKLLVSGDLLANLSGAMVLNLEKI